MITVLYHWEKTKDVWSDDEREIVGQDTVKEGIATEEFKTQTEMEDFLEGLSVSEGESEGTDHYTILAVYDKKTAWYEKHYSGYRE